MSKHDEVVRLARMFEEYEEESDGSTVFGQLYDRHYEKTYDEFRKADWCMMFVNFIMRLAGVSEHEVPFTASCPALLNYGKQHLKINKYPERGDICIFKLSEKDIASHVGIVTEMTDDTFLTIEGNRKHCAGSFRPWVKEDRVTELKSPIVVGFYHWEQEG